MFDDLKPSNPNPNPAAPTAPTPATSSVPMEDMFAVTDPTAERPSAVQAGRIRPVPTSPVAPPPVATPPEINTAPSLTGEQLVVTEARGSRWRKIMVVVVGALLALGLALGAYVFIFNRPQSASNIDNTVNTNSSNNNVNAITNVIDNSNDFDTNEITLPDNSINPVFADDDGDGLTNEEEANLGTNPLLADTDNDRLFDKDEVEVAKTDPISNDTDSDGLSDYEEVLVWYTNPRLPDTDGDSYSDGIEVQNGYNPLGAGTKDQWKAPAPPLPSN